MAVQELSTSLVFFAGLLLGSLLGLLIGRLRVRRELEDLQQRLRRLEKVAQENSSSRYDKHVEFGSMGLESGLLNEALCHMWPYLADIAKNLLFTVVEPKLQARLPKAMSGISFSRTECHFGQTPLRIRKLMASSDKEGSWQNLTFTTELVLNGDCFLELVLPNVGQRFLGSCAPLPTRIGVEQVKFRGTLVVEFTNLVPRVPLISGMRVYFINPPMLDLTMTGGLSGVLNVSLVKQHILEAMAQGFAQNIVLPKRQVHRFAKDIDVFKLKAPQPEGMLRLEIADILGEAMEATPGRLYIKVIFGDRDWQTVVGAQGKSSMLPWASRSTDSSGPKAETVVDLTVHNRSVQTLCIQVYGEESTRLWGPVRGQLIAQSWVPCCALIEESDAWWPLVMRSESNSTLSRLEGRFSVSKARDHGVSLMNNPAEVRLRCEWRPFTTVAPEHFDKSPDKTLANGWKLCKEVDLGVTCTLLVGIHSASNLPLELARYWCVVDCSSEVVLSMNKAAAMNKKGDRKPKTTHRVKGKESAETKKLGTNVEAVWERPLLFHLQDPRQATVDLEVWQGTSRKLGPQIGGGACLGSISFPVAHLLRQEGLREVLHAPLETPRGPSRPPPLCELAEEATATRAIGPPRLQVELQLWMLGPSGESI